MELIYKGVGITDKVNIMSSDIYDISGGKADSAELMLSDPVKSWREWNPQKGDEFEIKHKGFRSGTMYVFFIHDNAGTFIIKGRSIPSKAKTPHNRSWEKIKFIDIAGDIANDYGFSLEKYGVSDWLYNRVDQLEIPDFKFLHERCIMESCCLKIHNKKIIIYSEPYIESLDPILTLAHDDLIEAPVFTTISEGLFSACSVKYTDPSNKLADYIFSPNTAPDGPILKIPKRLTNLMEAERFTRGWLRSANKWETYGEIKIQQNLTVAAGNNITLSGFGSFSGKYFVYECSQFLLGGKTVLNIRKVLEGY
jgi:hypothetical protein